MLPEDTCLVTWKGEERWERRGWPQHRASPSTPQPSAAPPVPTDSSSPPCSPGSLHAQHPTQAQAARQPPPRHDRAVLVGSVPRKEPMAAETAPLQTPAVIAAAPRSTSLQATGKHAKKQLEPPKAGWSGEGVGSEERRGSRSRHNRRGHRSQQHRVCAAPWGAMGQGRSDPTATHPRGIATCSPFAR